MKVFSLFSMVGKAYSTRCPHDFFPTKKFLCAFFLNFRAVIIAQRCLALRSLHLASITKSKPILSPVLIIFGDLRAAHPGFHYFLAFLTLLVKF
jgi:hypothetical protein